MSVSVPTLVYAVAAGCLSIGSVLSVVHNGAFYRGLVFGALGLLFGTLLLVRLVEFPAAVEPVLAALAAVFVVLAYYGGWKANIGNSLRIGRWR